MEKERLLTRNFVLCTVTCFCFTIVFFMFYTGMSSYASDVLDADSTVAGLVASIFIVGDLVARLAVGRRVSSFGPRRMSLICMSAGTAVTLLYFVSDSVASICIVRFVHGITYGAAASAINTMVAESLPVPRRGEGLGYFMLSYSFASAVGPFICMYLMSHGTYEDIFTIGVIASAVAAFTSALLKETRTPAPGKREGVHLSDFVERSAVVMAAVAFVMFFSYSGVLTFISPYGEEIGLTSYATVFFVVLSVATLICRLFLGKVYDTKGENVALIPAILAYLAGMVMLGTVVNGAEMLVAAFLIGIMVAMVSAVVQAVIIRRAPKERYGVAVSTYNVAVDLSYAVGPVVNGAVIGAVGYASNYLVMACIGLGGLIMYIVLHGIHVRGRAPAEGL